MKLQPLLEVETLADAVIVGDEEQDPSSAELSAHEAAVAEGATAVQAEQAAESAAEAKAAAEIALQAAEENAKTAESVVEATVAAQQSAAGAGVSAEMVMEALRAQTSAIETLAAELKESRKQAVPAEPKKPAPDRPPSRSGPRWRRA